MSQYQKGKTNLDFTDGRETEWQWHQLGHMQVCIWLQTDNHASTPPLSFLQVGWPSCCPTNSVKALKAKHWMELKAVMPSRANCSLEWQSVTSSGKGFHAAWLLVSWYSTIYYSEWHCNYENENYDCMKIWLYYYSKQWTIWKRWISLEASVCNNPVNSWKSSCICCLITVRQPT